MGTTHEVTIGSVHVQGAWASPIDDGTRAELAVYTKTGQARIAPLDESDLVKLIEQAAIALRQLQTKRNLVERRRMNIVAQGITAHVMSEPVDTSARALLDECDESRHCGAETHTRHCARRAP